MLRRALFPVGRLLATPAALAALERTNESGWAYLARHVQGDFGDLDEEDRRANEEAITGGTRIFSAYNLKDGTRIWIITEADRSYTTILLPSDY